MALRERARATRTGEYDCVALLSGGKDSTYALFQLVEMGFEVYALTLDNGFISDGAKENVRRSMAALGIDHEFATTEPMAAIFRDSRERHSNVCQGCYKTIYTLGTNRAVDLGAPLVVTGLSRGQLFETRLIPAQFSEQRFDPDAIDAAVVAARRSYHRIDDAVRRLMDTDVFDDDALFERIEFVDFSIGAKAYRTPVVRRYESLISDGSAYVLDLVYYVHRDGGRAVQIPVACEDYRSSRFNLGREAVHKFANLARLWWRRHARVA